MYETVLYDFAKLVLDKLTSPVLHEIKLVLGVDHDHQLQKLETNLSAIRDVLRDAERQQNVSDSVRNWLNQLQEIVYEIDDVLDEIAYEALGTKSGGFSQLLQRPLKKIRTFFSSSNSVLIRYKIARRFRDVTRKLEKIDSNRRQFKLQPEVSRDDGILLGYWQAVDDPRETHSKVQEIFGREEDVDEIVNCILRGGDNNNNKDVHVVPLVGVAGVGKTVVAKKVYNDGRINANFNTKIWVYVSKNYSRNKILREIIKSVLKVDSKGMSIEEMRASLSTGLKGGKYFILLDDWWNENPNDWSSLKELINVGQLEGSTVVITTRSSRVASIVRTAASASAVDEFHGSMMMIKPLPADVCRLIFKHQLALFKDDALECKLTVQLEHYVEKIVEMCEGIPLVLTSISSLLKGVTDEEEWQRVIGRFKNRNFVDDDVLNVLKLSYDQLPNSHLKTCFRLLSIAPRGRKMFTFELIYKWMALGIFLRLEDAIIDYKEEYVAKKCLKEMVARSLLQEDSESTETGKDSMLTVKMHDCFYDLAKSLVGHELALVDCEPVRIDQRAKHIIFFKKDLSSSLVQQRFLEAARSAKTARSFSLIPIDEYGISTSFLNEISTLFKCLRVLDIKDCDIEELPSSIGNLKHLRYLDISGNKRMKTLPNSLRYLLNLQTLNLAGCSLLQKVPDDIGMLKSLRFLILTCQQEQLPKSVGLLFSLRYLILFECPNLASLPRSLENLKELESLFIGDCSEMDLLSDSSVRAIGGLDGLKKLGFVGLPRFSKLHRYSVGTSVVGQSLKDLTIDNNEGLYKLGGWVEQFTSLERLDIDNCTKLTSLGDGFSKLRKLRSLNINNCPGLIAGCERDVGEFWPLISHISEIVLDGQQV